MAVLVTGGAGFVGLNLVEALLARGEEVVSFDCGAPPPAAERAWATQRGRLQLVAGDMLDAAALGKAFAASRIDRVLHCAALIHT